MSAYDLSLVPFDDIFAEMTKRFDLLVMAFVHQPEGVKQPETRYCSHSKVGRQTDVLGLAEAMSTVVRHQIIATMRYTAPGGPLDPPMQPPMRGTP